MKFLWIAAGGAFGALARYWLGTYVTNKLGPSFPYGTLVINVTGSFVLGLFITLGTQKIAMPPNWRLFVAVGFLGAYTTFSTFTYETMALVSDGSLIRAGLNIAVSVVLGLFACFLGIVIGRAI